MKAVRCRKKGMLYGLFSICLFFTIFLGWGKQTDAASGYVLKINRKTNIVTAYKNNVPVRVMLCSTGKNNATPLGTFYTQQKIRWHVLDGPVYGQYCTRISGHYLFHSVYYYTMGDKTDLAVSQYKKLGNQASHGCVRLTVEDAKWIYDNCSVGTKVVIYEDDDIGALGKPSNVKVSSSLKEKWDPTDPDPTNPHYINRPTIKISSKKATTITVGDKYSLKANIKVTDYKGKNITSKLRVNGRVDTTKPGVYYLKYWAQDSNYNYAYKYFTVTVKEAKKPVFVDLPEKKTLKISSKYIGYNYTDVESYDRDGTSLTKKIKITIPNKYKNVIKKVAVNKKKYLRFYAPGTYSVKFSVTGTKSNGAKTTTKTVKFTVKDYATPVIKDAVGDETIYTGSLYGKEQILNGITAATRFTTLKTSKVTYKINGKTVEAIDTSVPGTYVIKYTITTSTGVKSKTVKRTVTVVEAPVETPEDTTTETPEDTTTETPEDTTTETPEDTTTEAPEDTTTEAPEDTTTEAPEDTTTEAPEMPEDTTTATPEDAGRR